MVKYTDKTLMTFGKYKGTALANIPASYLLWAREEFDNLSQPLKEYIEENLQALQQEARKAARLNSR